ncbi:hypothetical protein CDCA_CDCA03G0953 [Cyanidium caldarium]|uniref:Peptidase M41 domain-containing protein n=1 Tax=Cyanidium caldarium TaxID=2771 RepID=A0AAV9IRP7_CYACA|nr:hypothetical protein CDCA_CDCA03G0953 [Cyanidium caldarium]
MSLRIGWSFIAPGVLGRHWRPTGKFTTTTTTTGSFNVRGAPPLRQVPSRAALRCSLGTRQRPELLLPLRVVGMWELEREMAGRDVDWSSLATDRGSDLTETVFGAVIGAFVLLWMVPTLIAATNGTDASTSQNGLAGLALLALSGWAVDTFGFNSALQRVVVDNFLTDKRRVALHEAGHAVVAHLLGCPVESYTMRRAGALLGGRNAVQVRIDPLRAAADGTSVDEKVAVVAMAGVAAELLLYGDAYGGMEDVRELQARFRKRRPLLAGNPDASFRWALLAALQICARYRNDVERVADAMQRGVQIEECLAGIPAGAP